MAKKILQSNVVETKDGICDFCHEAGNFISGSCTLPLAKFEDVMEIKDGPFKSHFQHVYSCEYKEVSPMICPDCIKEYAKLYK